MTVRVGHIYTRKTPKGDAWDRVRVICPSPLAETEFVIGPTDPFAGADDDAERRIVSTSATPESLLAAYDYDGEAESTPTVLGENALGAFLDGLD